MMISLVTSSLKENMNQRQGLAQQSTHHLPEIHQQSSRQFSAAAETKIIRIKHDLHQTWSTSNIIHIKHTGWLKALLDGKHNIMH